MLVKPKISSSGSSSSSRRSRRRDTRSDFDVSEIAEIEVLFFVVEMDCCSIVNLEQDSKLRHGSLLVIIKIDEGRVEETTKASIYTQFPKNVASTRDKRLFSNVEKGPITKFGIT
uniref:Uncharacterized protein n=1 Tax=Romanomermis culicivorax TaxID=13658 RepID=A0A915HXB2_ROMCU